MNVIEQGYRAISDLNLWLKIQTNEQYTIADISALIKLRVDYIFSNWNFIKPVLLDRQPNYIDPDRLKSEIDAFDSLVKTMSDSAKKPNDNYLLSNYFTVFDTILFDDLQISSQEQSIVDGEVSRVSKFTKNNFLYIRDQLIAARDTIADSIGGQDDTYNAIYGRSSTPASLSKNISSISLSHNFQKCIIVIEFILANISLIQGQARIDPFAFAKANANNPDFKISSYTNGRLVKLQYGETLPQLAARAYGDPERWPEIAVANNLKPPYIDEVGEKIYLIANAKGNQINIAERSISNELNSEKFYINQILMIQSNTERFPDQRSVVNITTAPISGELIIELSGDSNLDKYKIADSAYVRVFKPNTINSSFFIMIPTNEQVSSALPGETPWFLRTKASDEKNAGVDLFLSENGDIGFTQFGDLQLNYGTANALQAVQILLATQEGSLVRHPTYGITAGVGLTNNNVSQIKKIISDSIAHQIRNDSRFDRLESLSVEYVSGKQNAAYFDVRLVVVLAGGSTAVPVSFTITPN